MLIVKFSSSNTTINQFNVHLIGAAKYTKENYVATLNFSLIGRLFASLFQKWANDFPVGRSNQFSYVDKGFLTEIQFEQGAVR